MKTLLRLVFAGLCLLILVLPAVADESGDDLESDARNAEEAPPMIPHRVDADASGEACLACHRTGLNSAPVTPHAMRLDCVQCHVQGEVKAKKPDKKRKKSKKSEKDEK
jgi:nitrate reductase cytochrome c-type subunit